MFQPRPDEIARRVLEPGETLLWAGRPSVLAYGWNGKMVGVFVFGLFWLGFCSLFVVAIVGAMVGAPGYSMTSGTPEGALAFMALWALPGVFCVSAPFYFGRKSRRTVYALTSQRLVKVTTREDRSGEVTGTEQLRVNTVSVERRKRNRGNLLVYRFGSGEDLVEERLWGIDNPSHVAEMLGRQRFFQLATGGVMHPVGGDPREFARTDEESGEAAGQEPPKPIKPMAAVAAVLLPGECVWWQERPNPSAMLSGSRNSSLLIGVVVLLLGSVFLWALASSTFDGAEGPDWVVTWFAWPFTVLVTLIGVYSVIRHFRELRRARRTVYAITDRRILVVTDPGSAGRDSGRRYAVHGPAGKPSAEPLDISRVTEFRVELSGSGFGSLLLGNRREGVQINGQYQPIGIFGIRDPMAVRRLLRHHPATARLM